jgi:ATP-dependent DNA helicase UvrD/PcrA
MTALRPDEQPFEAAPPEIALALGGRAPTVQQWQAISHDLSPCAVVAGAGSGKTAVMAARVVYLTLVRSGRLDPATVKAPPNAGAMPSEILCLTFTNKAAEELANRVRAATATLGLPEGEEVTVLTYHAFAARLLDDYGLRMGLEAGPMLLTTAHRWQLATGLFTDVTFQNLEVRTVSYPVMQMLTLADQCANHLVDPLDLAARSERFAERKEIKSAGDRDAHRSALRRAELARLVHTYQERKRALGVIDYGDQIVLACDLVVRFPEVVADFRSRYPVVLLDEYQDTNHAQAVLLERLTGAGYPVMCVGDPDQNIYAWRGASLRNILRFSEDYAGGRRPLYVNFRSGSRILDAANAVIDEVPEDRRAKDKELRPHPDRGEGRVLAFVAEDERSEAERIARIIASEHDGGREYRSFAVLCRKKRLFAPIADVLRQAGIPHEVVDLGGLLALPEIVDVVAWLRLLDDPSRNIALARILQGPRWRIGYRDIVTLARWSARNNKTLRVDLGEDEHPGDVAFALGEALDHLDEMEGLSAEAAERLGEFRTLFNGLRAAATGPLDELVTQILERSGLLRELEASSSVASVSARRNLLNFVGSVSHFAPVEGEATLGTLVSYLDAAEEGDEDFEQVQVSDENTVKLMTIHKAKGLEWDVVFVPGLVEGRRSSLFPDTSRQPNPVKQPHTLPFDVRGDAEVLPEYTGNLNRFKDELTQRALEEERRLCYVALTRAREVLVVSAAHWYEGPMEPFTPGRFFTEIARNSACEVIERAECPAENPIVEARRARVASWPVPARGPDADELFPGGWHDAAIREAAAPGTIGGSSLPPAQREELDVLLASHRERVSLVEGRSAVDARPVPPTTLSVSGLLEFERCPKLFYWEYVRPLPRRPSAAARVGTEAHRWIELQSRGQAALFDVDEQPDLAPEERLTGEDVSVLTRVREAWRDSRFAAVTPLYTERPFLLHLDGFLLGGRIDAIFGSRDGAWEIVDYKTGRVPAAGDPVAGLQLDVYALACHEVWGKSAEDLTLTYFYVAEGKEVSRRAGDPAETRARVLEALRSIAQGRFDPTPGEQCTWCGFLGLCDAGRAFVDGATSRSM